jgi:hypothetical protein
MSLVTDVATVDSPLLRLGKYLSKATENYSTCLDALPNENAHAGIAATVRFHYLKLDPVTGNPMFAELARILADQLAEYCFSTRRYESLKHPHEHHNLHGEAREFLRRVKTSGEAGEVLIYFLTEAILGAPQLIAKMQLKTSTKLESFGADGLHIKWNDIAHSLDVYCAEAKLEDRPSDAVANIVRSLSKFHLNEDYKHELRLATAHFKHSDEDVKNAVARILENKEPDIPWKLRHACLVGYDWNGYSNLAGRDLKVMEQQFRNRYMQDRDRLHELLVRHFGKLDLPLIAFEIFFLPFRSVQEFRDAFDKAV